MKKSFKLFAVASTIALVSISAVSTITYAAKEKKETSDAINSKVNSILSAIDNSTSSASSTYSARSATSATSSTNYNYKISRDEMTNSSFYSIDTDNYTIRLEKDNLDTKGVYSRTGNFNTVSSVSKDTAQEVANSLYSSLSLPTEYDLVYLEKFDDNLWEADFQKSYNGTYNQFEAVKMIFSADNQEIAALTVFNEAYENFTVSPSVSENTAIETALSTNKISDSENIEATLGFARSNDFVDENSSSDDTSIHEVWCVKEKDTEDETTIFVDANTGNVIGGETVVW